MLYRSVLNRLIIEGRDLMLELDTIVEQILIAESREDVAVLLVGLKKATLVNLAIKLDIYHTNKTKEMLTNAIVEGTIGAKLRSMAIRKILLISR
jgi:hypothetical protein